MTPTTRPASALFAAVVALALWLPTLTVPPVQAASPGVAAVELV